MPSRTPTSRCATPGRPAACGTTSSSDSVSAPGVAVDFCLAGTSQAADQGGVVHRRQRPEPARIAERIERGQDHHVGRIEGGPAHRGKAVVQVRRAAEGREPEDQRQAGLVKGLAAATEHVFQRQRAALQRIDAARALGLAGRQPQQPAVHLRFTWRRRRVEARRFGPASECLKLGGGRDWRAHISAWRRHASPFPWRSR